jgi:transcriptional regulator with XRE-family HTH domain
VKRRKPRDYLEWRTLRRWDELPEWEDSPLGYLLREARESVGVTQAELARRLGRSQQAIAQAERWASNPTAAFIRAWADALGLELQIAFVKARHDPDRTQGPDSREG